MIGTHPYSIDGGASPRSASVSAMPSAAAPLSDPIPLRQAVKPNAEAGPGPSSEGTSRRSSRTDSLLSSSAPPVPSVISVTHPSQFIHTHHPRRGSLTPLGLNVISPVLPIQIHPTQGTAPHSPVRSVGFAPSVSWNDGSPKLSNDRRASGASTSSTLTQSRPPNIGYNKERRRSSLVPNSIPLPTPVPAGFNPEARRSSLTPSNPTLAQPSSSRIHVAGSHYLGNPISGLGSGQGAASGSSQVEAPLLASRNRTADGPSRTGGQTQESEGRRGSMPHLYGGWPGPAKFNPVLPPPRGSVDREEPLPDEGFKFGAGINGGSSMLLGSPTGSRPAHKRRISLDQRDVFKSTEAEEADRQRKAFEDATFGNDGRRARERLTLGATHHHNARLQSPPNRRPSLILWEKIGMAASAKAADTEGVAAAASVPFLPSAPIEDVGPRRGSLPIAIPLATGRRASYMPHSPLEAPISSTGQTPESEEDSGLPDQQEQLGQGLFPPIRPMPPLLPLSDPGPRFLPSTLALQRASHLLQSRNLQVPDLPHPLPPSLHPPKPVDVTEFDIDFILAGSSAQLGRDKRVKNAPIDVAAPSGIPDVPTPTLKLGAGGDDEDSFAKFVGKFDDEYGDRRGEWTFRAMPSTSSTLSAATGPWAEWESPGAGRYKLFANGDVQSVQSGAVWRIIRKGLREYEIDEIQRHPSASASTSFSSPISPSSPIKPTNISLNDSHILTSKATHCQHGGVKLPSMSRASADLVAALPNTTQDGRYRVSVSDAPGRTTRLDSGDSILSTSRTISQSLPLTSAMAAALTPKKKRRDSKEEDVARGREALGSTERHSSSRGKSRDRGDKDKDKEKEKEKSGGFFKRGIMASIKSSNFVTTLEDKKAQREERERERAQSHSWSGVGTQPNFIHPSGRNTPPALDTFQPHSDHRHATSASTSVRVASSTRTSSSDDRLPPWLEDQTGGGLSRRSSGKEEMHWKEGKGWQPVSDDAVAMVIPIDDDAASPDSAASARQALLVWYVPFTSEEDDRPAPSAPTINRIVTPTANEPTLPVPKLHKLLRRRTSKERDLKRHEASSPLSHSPIESMRSPITPSSAVSTTTYTHPLPFRSFRIVARVTDLDELRTEPTVPSVAFAQWRAANPLSTAKAASLSSSANSPAVTGITCLPSTEEDNASSSTAPTTSSHIMAGRTFPTVIAVCHSRSQGVEFVLEGLDRLGFCLGDSAWGPTGYEEWRGSGLSEKGRELVDLLWTGCTGVMGLTGA